MARIARNALLLIALAAACSPEQNAASPAVDAAQDPATDPDADDGDSDDDTESPQQDAAAPAPHDAGVEVVDAAEPGPTFPPVDDFGAAGPFETVREAAGDACTAYRPKTLGENGRRHPVIIWGNGTYTPTEQIYQTFYNHWASHGFIVVAAHTSNAGTGMEMLACLDWVEAEDGRAGSPYEGHVAKGLAGASGHSQGGGGALMTGRDPRVRVTAPVMAYTSGLGHEASCQGQQHGPILLLSGGMDTTAPPDVDQKPVFDHSNVPTVWVLNKAATHVAPALGGAGPFLGPTTAWFRLHLMNDSSARSLFYGADCTLCVDDAWTVQWNEP